MNNQFFTPKALEVILPNLLKEKLGIISSLTTQNKRNLNFDENISIKIESIGYDKDIVIVQFSQKSNNNIWRFETVQAEDDINKMGLKILNI